MGDYNNNQIYHNVLFDLSELCWDWAQDRPKQTDSGVDRSSHGWDSVFFKKLMTRVPVSEDGGTGPETEAAKYNSAINHFIIYHNKYSDMAKRSNQTFSPWSKASVDQSDESKLCFMSMSVRIHNKHSEDFVKCVKLSTLFLEIGQKCELWVHSDFDLWAQKLVKANIC